MCAVWIRERGDKQGDAAEHQLERDRCWGGGQRLAPNEVSRTGEERSNKASAEWISARVGWEMVLLVAGKATSAEDVMRGVAGGVLLGVPLLYTQETWLHGRSVSPVVILAGVIGHVRGERGAVLLRGVPTGTDPPAHRGRRRRDGAVRPAVRAAAPPAGPGRAGDLAGERARRRRADLDPRQHRLLRRGGARAASAERRSPRRSRVGAATCWSRRAARWCSR